MSRRVRGQESLPGPFVGYLGEGASLRGDLNLDGDCRIDGCVDGNVTSTSSLVIGPNGRLTCGRLRADALSIGGEVRCQVIIAKRLDVLPGGRLVGRVLMDRRGLNIAPGGSFEGTVEMPGATPSERAPDPAAP